MLALGGHHHQRDVALLGPLADLGDELVAILHRHVPVDQEPVGDEAVLHRVQRSLAVGRLGQSEP